jgi:hypothetical protein
LQGGAGAGEGRGEELSQGRTFLNLSPNKFDTWADCLIECGSREGECYIILPPWIPQREPTCTTAGALQRRPAYKVLFVLEGSLWILGFGVRSRPHPSSGPLKSTLPGPREGSSILEVDFVVVTAAVFYQSDTLLKCPSSPQMLLVVGCPLRSPVTAARNLIKKGRRAALVSRACWAGWRGVDRPEVEPVSFVFADLAALLQSWFCSLTRHVACRRPAGGPQEACRRPHPEVPRRPPGGLQGAPRKPPGGLQEASRRQAPRRPAGGPTRLLDMWHAGTAPSRRICSMASAARSARA